MRILVLIYEYPPVGGGGGMVARDISQELARLGHEVRVITAHYKDLPRLDNSDGVCVKRIPAGRRSMYKASLFEMLCFVLAGIWQGMLSIRSWRPDIIHVHFAVPTGPVAWVLSRLTGIPYVLTAHLGDVPGGVPDKTAGWFRWIYPFTRPIWRDATQVVAVSNYTRQLALQHYPVEIQVIHNGVDRECLNPGELRLNRPARIFFAGRFVAQKNPLQIITTLEALKDLDWDCVLVGDGALREKMTGRIRLAGLQDRIHLPGWIKPEQVVHWMRSSDILFMPSLAEGLPVVGVQSLAMGLAIVASLSGGFIDLVENGLNGYLIDCDRPGDYAGALRGLLSDPERLLEARRASNLKAQAFDIHTIVAAYEELLMSACLDNHQAD
jgi:glycosyltransferase involved in cell wall biosynthesis